MFQEPLLDFLTAQTISHGAQLVAASLASLTFISAFLNRTAKNFLSAKTLFFIVTGGALSGLTIYLLFRLLFYSHLLNSTMAYSFETAKESYFKLWNKPLEEDFISYYRFILYITIENCPFHWLDNFSSISKPGFCISILAGLIINWLIWFIYKKDQIDRSPISSCMHQETNT